jgi:hypothetical protein
MNHSQSILICILIILVSFFSGYALGQIEKKKEIKTRAIEILDEPADKGVEVTFGELEYIIFGEYQK